MPAPSAPPATLGQLASKPLAHLFVYMLDKELTGSLELTTSDGEVATVVLLRGAVAKIKTSEPVAYLGSVLYELGFVDSAEVDASLLELSRQKRPHGQILLARGSIREEELAIGLREQALRKLAHLFAFGPETTFCFQGGADLLPSYGGERAVLVDPVPAIWRGIREHPPEGHVRELLARIGDRPCRLAAWARIERFDFQAEELALIDAIRGGAASVPDLRETGILPSKTTDLLVYCLFILKQIERTPATSAPAPSSGAVPLASSPPAGFRASQAPPPRTTYPPGPISFNLRIPTSPTLMASSRPQPPLAATEVSERERGAIERARAIQKEDYFQRLSLPRDATTIQVEEAFMALREMWEGTSATSPVAEVREARGVALAALLEAYETLRDGAKRAEYARGLVLGSLGAALHDSLEDLAVSGAENDLDGAKACLKKNDLERAERMARRASKAQPDSADALALVAWLEALQPDNQSVDATRVRIATLDRALRIDPECELAVYYRALLYKRIDNHAAAMRDFSRVVAINPDHLDAVRELRIYEMRVRRGSLTMKAVRPNPTSSGVKSIGLSSSRDLVRKK